MDEELLQHRPKTGLRGREGRERKKMKRKKKERREKKREKMGESKVSRELQAQIQERNILQVMERNFLLLLLLFSSYI